MAGDLRGFALEKAELLSSRVKELLSSGQGYVRAQFGVDLGLKPELYPPWAILCTAAAGLLLTLCVSWAAVRGGLLVGKRRASKRGSPVTQGSGEPVRASLAKAEEQKKRSKKKTPDKKTHSNGQPVTACQEDVKEAVVVSKLSPQTKTEKVHEVYPPVQAKKNKKKTKPDVKSVQQVSTSDGKEPDDVGAWETKVSNREKRQQRRKDKGPEDSGSPAGVDAYKVAAPAASAPTNTKRSRGNQEPQRSRPTGKGDTASGAVSSSWREEHSVNGGGWADISLKLPSQMGAIEGAKWSTVSTVPHYRAQAESQRWGQETRAWSGMDGRTKTDLNPVTRSMLALNNNTGPISNSIELQWTNPPDAADEWSGFNGMSAVDPSSDWNAPAEHWGNYEEPLLVATPVPPPKPKDQPEPNKQVSEDEKDTEMSSGGVAKSKKKRKKKKKTEEEAATEAQIASQAVPKAQELPVLVPKKQNSSISSSQKFEQTVEPPKPSQKKKVRREP